MKITNWDWTLERESELCSFSILEDDPYCWICGKRCEHSMNQWHAGPTISVSGWLETDEKHDILADVWRGLKLPTRDGIIPPDILIHVTDRTIPIERHADLKGEIVYRYSFAGSKFVGYETREDVPTPS